MAGEIVTFSSNGARCQGYLAQSGAGGPGVIVLQEWWGLVDQIKRVADRFAEAGFVALAPDLYHGQSTKVTVRTSRGQAWGWRGKGGVWEKR